MKLTGYILPPEVATAILAEIAAAFDSRDLPRFWSPGKYIIHTGPHAGLALIPAGDLLLGTPLRGKPIQTPQNYPEFSQLITALGGLDSRTEIDSQALIDPNAETL